MELSDEKTRDVLELKERITEKIEHHEEEIEFLKRNLEIIDSMIKQTSFTKASALHSSKQPENTAEPEHAVKPEQDAIPITQGSDGSIIANAYVTPEQVSIVLNDDLGLNAETPPFQSFFMGRIIAEMKKKDGAEVEQGKIQKESVIDCMINKNGSSIREIIIKNYRQQERVKEIINTAGWSLSRMLEHNKK